MEKIFAVAETLKRDLQLSNIMPSTLLREAEVILSIASQDDIAEDRIIYHIATMQIRLKHTSTDEVACRKAA